MLRLRPVSRSHRAARTWTWAPPPSSRWSTAAQAYRSGSSPAQAVSSKASRTLPICSSVGSSSSAHAITPEVYLCSNPRASATDATRWGSPRRTSTPSRGCPAASRSPRRYAAAARADPVPRARNLMCIRVRALGGVQRPERPVDGDQVADHLDGLDGLLVGIGPASDLVEVVAKARQFAGTLALDLGVCHGPRPHPADRPAHQIRQRQARGARLGVPLGTLRLAGADLHPDGASSAHGAPLPLRGSEGARPPASPCRGHAKRGPKGWAGLRTLRA